MELLLAVVVPSSDIQDRVGAKALLIRLFVHFECLQMSQSRKLSKNYEDTALFSRSLREDCLHSTHGQALGMILETGS